MVMDLMICLFNLTPIQSSTDTPNGYNQKLFRISDVKTIFA